MFPAFFDYGIHIIWTIQASVIQVSSSVITEFGVVGNIITSTKQNLNIHFGYAARH
jgi:hypothetical protein